MNLSPQWVDFLREKGIEAIHWAAVGDIAAKDSEIMEWAKINQYTVFTHDLDFSAILAATNANGPSVIQIRTQDVLPAAVGRIVVTAIKQFKAELQSGALLSIKSNTRVRILPLRNNSS